MEEELISDDNPGKKSVIRKSSPGQSSMAAPNPRDTVQSLDENFSSSNSVVVDVDLTRRPSNLPILL